MKKVLISALVLVFLLGVSFAYADDKCPAGKASAGCCAKGKAQTQAAASVSQKSETKVENPHAACAVKEDVKATSAVAPVEAQVTAEAGIEADTKVAGEMKVAEKGCPEVGEKTALNSFHENMHPMHVALEEAKYAEIREMYPKLNESSKGIADYKCDNWDKCSEECKKDFETKKAGLIKSIDELGVACKSEDNAKIDAAFGVMHEAYIGFASKCAHEKPAETKEAKIEETKQ